MGGLNFRGSDKIQKAYDYIKKASNNISDSKDKISEMVSLVENSSWSGESKKSFLNLIMLCEQLNDKLKDAAEENVRKISKFIDERDEFINNSLVIKELEE